MVFITLFLYGFLAACAALLVEALGLSVFSLSTSIALIMIPLAALIEEGTRWLFLRQFRLSHASAPPFLSPLSVGFVFASGYFAVELGLITFGFRPLVLVPLMGIFLVHLITSLFFAYYLFRLVPRTLFHTTLLFIGMVVLHTAYNMYALS